MDKPPKTILMPPAHFFEINNKDNKDGISISDRQ